MKRYITLSGLLIFSLFLFSFSLVQTQAQTPQRRSFMSEEVQYLTRLIRDIRELDKDKKVAITKAQAQKLIPILQELAKTNSLPKKEADKFINRIEGVLTDAQIIYLDKLQIERQKKMEEMNKNRTQGQNRIQGQNQTQSNQQWRNQQPSNISQKEMAEFQKFMEEWSKGKPLNPFFHLNMYKKQLTDLIEYLKKK